MLRLLGLLILAGISFAAAMAFGMAGWYIPARVLAVLAMVFAGSAVLVVIVRAVRWVF